MTNLFSKIFFIFAAIYVAFFASKANASMLTSSLCSVTAEVIKLVDESDNHEIYLKVRGIVNDTDCPVKSGEVYNASNNYYAADNYTSSFKVGDIFKADIQGGSYNGPTGAGSYLNWSNITREDNSKIPYKLGDVSEVQTGSVPLTQFNQTDELTLEQDCLIGAGDIFERWACKNNFFSGLAPSEVLSEIAIGVGFLTLISAMGFIYLNRRK